MPDLTVSAPIDAFMAATTAAEARGAIGLGASRLCLVDTFDPGDFEIIDNVSVVFAWPNVTQTSPVYDTATGLFTIPQAGAYCIKYNFVASMVAWVAGGVYISNVTTGDSLGSSSWTLRTDLATQDASGCFVFAAEAGDVIEVSTYNACNGGFLVAEYFGPSSGINKFSLTKL